MPKVKEETKEVKKEITLESLQAQLDGLCAEARRHSDSWIRHMNTYHCQGNGKVGRASIASMLITAAITAMCGIVFAGTIDNKSQGTGTYTLIQASDGTGNITLTVDAVASDITGDITLGDSTSTIAAAQSNGTVRTSVKIVPDDFANTPTWVTRWVGLGVGEVSGTTAYGFGDTNTAGYGFLTSWGRTTPATANWDGVSESPFEARMLNKLTNNAAYAMTGGHIKSKNYSTGTVGDMRGLWIEIINDGTATTESGLYISDDSTTIDNLIDMLGASTPGTSDIRFSNGAIMKNGDANTLTITEANVAVAGALDADSLTVNAAAGVDAQSGGALNFGVTTATSVNVSKSGAVTTIKGTLNVDEAVTLDGTLGVVGETTIDGKYAVVGPDATTGLMVLGASVTSTAEVLQTNVFATAFATAPVVTCTYTEDPGAITVPIYITAVTTTNFQCVITSDKNFSYIAVGARP